MCQARQDKNVVRCKQLRKGVQHTRAMRRGLKAMSSLF